MTLANRLLFGSIVALVAACGPGGAPPEAPTITFEPDPRLGVVVLDRAAREPNSAGRESIDLARVEVTSDGVTHVLVGLGPWRAFGDGQVEAGEVMYRAVLPDGRLEVRPSPPLGAPLLGNYATQGTPDGKLVVLQSGNLAAGQLARVLVYDGSAWIQHELLRNDRPDATVPKAGNVQARAFDPQTILFQYDGGLVRNDDGKWVEVETPRGATTLRLGPYDANGVRLLWLDARGTLHSRLLDRATWTLTGPESLYLKPGMTFGEHWNWSGTPDAFVLDLDAGPNAILSTRFARNGFRDLPTAGGTPGLELRASYDGLRASRVLVDTAGAHLQPLYQGAVSGPEVIVPRNAGVSCETDCHEGETLDDGTTPRVSSRNPACLQCFSRTLLLWALDLTHDGKTLHALYADDIQEGRRLYLKRFTWPEANDPFLSTGPVADTAYPGEPAAVPEEPLPPEPALARVRVLRVGRTNHAGSNVTITGLGPDNQQHTESVSTAADGWVDFSPMTKGAYRVEAADGTFHATRDVTLTALETTLDPIVLEAEALATDAPAGADVVGIGKYGDFFLKSGTTLYRQSPTDATTQVLTTTLSAGPKFFADNEVVVWKSGDNVEGITSGASVTQVPPLLAGFVDLDEVRPLGAGLAVPSAGYNGQARPFGWYDRMLQRTPFFRDSVDVIGNAWCQSAWLWSTTSTAGLFEVNVQNSCDRPPNGTPITVIGRNVPRLYNQVTGGFGTRAAAGTEEASCGLAAGPGSTCTLWRLGGSEGDTGRVSERAILYSVAWNELYYMERATDGTLSLRASSLGAAAEPIVSGSALAVSRSPGETWLATDGTVNSGTQRAYWRQSDGVWLSNTLAADRRGTGLVVPGAVRMRETVEVQGGYAYRALVVEVPGTAGATDCANGCNLIRIRLDSAIQEVRGRIRGDENYAFHGSTSLVDGDVWSDCPGGPCRVVSSTSPGATRVPFVRGTLAIGREDPLLRLEGYVPVVFDGRIRVAAIH